MKPMTEPMTPAEIENAMDGRLRETGQGRSEALLPSPCIQNHAPFLCNTNGGLECLWFGGSLEGKADISIHRSRVDDGIWGAPRQLSHDATRSEQNPVQFIAPDGRKLVFHTAQPSGNQDECVVRLIDETNGTSDLPLPQGTFIRAPMQVRADGAWLLPLFRCVQRPGQRWTGSHDTAALAISVDQGESWRQIEVPGSIGCVHMTLVPLDDNRIIAFFRRRQADFVHRSKSVDGGETWSVPAPVNVPSNNSSISAIRLRDGHIALACNPVNAAMSDQRRQSLYDEIGEDDRPNATGGCEPVWGVPRAPMAICISGDDGMSFATELVIEEGPGSCLTNNSIDGQNLEMSYPSLVQNADGGLDLAYTYHRRAIKHVRLSAEWLAARLPN
jgi:predicted neuraminidase